MGGVEQSIDEAVSECQPGFCGGWVSGFALDLLLEQKRMGSRINPRRRTEILASLGYVLHPALKDGRVGNAFTDPGSGKTGKPRLFVLEGHLSCNVTSSAEAVKMYVAAQSETATLASAAFSLTERVEINP
jgi:hypothetical protein